MRSRHPLVRALVLGALGGLFVTTLPISADPAGLPEFACCLVPRVGGTGFDCHPFTNATECISILGGTPADAATCSAECGTTTNRPPDCSNAEALRPRLAPPEQPPNHALVPVDVIGVIDPDGDPVLVTITDIFQDEEVADDGSGPRCPDGDLEGAAVRAERQGKGNGRVYHITFVADDGLGGTCQDTVQVCVPHDPSSSCIDEGPLFDSTDLEGCDRNVPLDGCLADCAVPYANCVQVAHIDFNECLALELRPVCAVELAANLALCRETLRQCRFRCFLRFGDG